MKKLYVIIFIFLVKNTMAQIYLSEDFNYGSTASNLCGSTGVTTNWVPFRNAGINPVQYSTTNLSYTGYSTGATSGSGSMSYTLTSGTREWVYTPVTAISSGSVYLSFLMKSTATGTTTYQSDWFMSLSGILGLDSIAGPVLFIQTPMLLPGYKLGISKNGGAVVYGSTTYSSSNTVLVIVKYVFNTVSRYDDSVYAWLYTSGVPATEPAPMLTVSNIGTYSDVYQIRSVIIKQSNSITPVTAPITIDAMRVGTSWSNSVLLPVTWLDASAKLQTDNTVLLNWSTASEINNDHFEIERSTDNSPIAIGHWSLVGKVNGNGTSNLVHSYQFADDISNFQLPISNLYYRLKQFDINGKYEYSKVMNVELNKTENYDISIYPNPARNELNIGTKNKALMNLELFDNTGKLIYQNSFIQNLSFNISNYPSGIYFFKINDSETGNIKTKKIVVGK